jgi:hypothetical protein
MKSKFAIKNLFILQNKMSSYIQSTLTCGQKGQVTTEITPYLNSTYKPRFYACDIAKLVGQSSFQTPTQALYEYLKADKFFKPWVRQIWQETNNNKQLLVWKSLQAMQPQLKAVTKNVSHVGQGAENVDIRIKEQVTTIIKHLNKDEKLAPEILNKVNREATSRVNMSRGVNLEAVTLDTLAVQQGYAITGKNDKKYFKDFGNFIISGKVDGIDASQSRVIEIKNRTRFMSEPPHYDKIQCLIYMVLTEMKSCLLVEHFPDGQIRETQLDFNEEQFNEIYDKLEQLTFKIRCLTKNGLAELIAQHDEETFKI